MVAFRYAVINAVLRAIIDVLQKLLEYVWKNLEIAYSGYRVIASASNVADALKQYNKVMYIFTDIITFAGNYLILDVISTVDAIMLSHYLRALRSE